jgi:hypothetical protein
MIRRTSNALLLAAIALLAGCSAATASDDDGGVPDAGASPTRHDAGGAADGATPHADASAPSDAGHPQAEGGGQGPGHDAGAVEASGAESGTSPPADAGPTQEQLAWLVPQNEARAAVGESPLAWDPIAAQVAQAYASQCNFQHNPDRNGQYDALGGTGGVGENIAAGAPTQSVDGAVGSWVGEQQYYDHASNSCASGQECGHYTQVVWTDTTGVGCAKVSCTTNSPFGSFASGQWDFSVCDYSPPGNVVGQSPY